MFHRLYPNLKFRQKNCTARRIFNFLLGFGHPDETLSLVFDILRPCWLAVNMAHDCLHDDYAKKTLAIVNVVTTEL